MKKMGKFVFSWFLRKITDALLDRLHWIIENCKAWADVFWNDILRSFPLLCNKAYIWLYLLLLWWTMNEFRIWSFSFLPKLHSMQRYVQPSSLKDVQWTLFMKILKPSLARNLQGFLMSKFVFVPDQKIPLPNVNFLSSDDVDNENWWNVVDGTFKSCDSSLSIDENA